MTTGWVSNSTAVCGFMPLGQLITQDTPINVPHFSVTPDSLERRGANSEYTLRKIFANKGMLAGSSTDSYYGGDNYENYPMPSVSFTSANVNTTSNTVSFANLGWPLRNRCPVRITGTPPGGLATGTTYYIIRNDTNQTIQFSSTETGSAIDLTSAGGNFTVAEHPYTLLAGQFNNNVASQQRKQRRAFYNNECSLHNFEKHGKPKDIQVSTGNFFYGNLDYVNRNCHRPAGAEIYFHSLFYNPESNNFAIWSEATNTATTETVIRRHIDGCLSWVRGSVDKTKVKAIEITNETVWGNITGGNYTRSASNVNVSANTISMSGTGFYWATNTRVKIYPTAGSTLPGGLTANTTYFVVGIVANTSIQLATSASGTPIDITSQGTGSFRIFSLMMFGDFGTGVYSQFLSAYNGGVVPQNRNWITYALQYAREQYPEYKYAINEAVTLGSTSGGKLNVFRNYVELLKYFRDEVGVMFDYIGIQNHHTGNITGGSTTFSKSVIKAQLDELAQFGVPIMITEFDFYNYENISNRTTSEYLARCREVSDGIAMLIETIASHPAVDTFCWWGLDNVQSWLGFYLVSGGNPTYPNLDPRSAGIMPYGYVNGSTAHASVTNYTRTEVYYKAMQAYERVLPYTLK